MSVVAAPADLRHMTSNQGLSSHRLSQHLRSSPARSPTSIPSSPTSVHSSSSAIFERDIEPLSPPSPQPYSSANAHRIPRSKTTEQIEHSVPSVLDSAAAILASMQGTNDVAVVAPAPYANTFAGSGFASPIGSFRSRSPSPTIGSLAAQGRNSLLLSIPQQSLSGSPPKTSSIVRPTPSIQTTNASPPAIVTPTSAYFTVADESETSSVAQPASEADGSPTTTTREHPLPSTSASASPPPSTQPTRTTSAPASSTNPAFPNSQPISPTSPASTTSLNAASKRLSFISYGDLLTSTPTSTLPLSSLTTAASAIEPPPHIPGVAGLTQGSPVPYPGSAGTSLRGFVINPHPIPHHVSGTLPNSISSTSSPSSPASAPLALDAFGPTSPNTGTQGSIRSPSRSHSPGKHESAALAMLGPGGPATLDDVGGEWEREGLGRGLEERLDVLYGAQP
ncbi:hypothetical protein Hypma_002754 [Hypsizygus marmoreus]|uniref:Uncharacterized protein n=1 Tax=Hypsizygus marmoreus TaxID=39966 RepID=A0A369J9K0_HYPMA|nr:hypothetical protein Hypma_002754 [Hypsizygus marmoreus]